MQNNTTTKPINQNKMKNIHVLVTDKPSRLHLGNSGLVLCDLIFNPTTINAQHIYITSDEEIKEEDWFYNTISLKPEPFKACENGDGYVNCSRYSHYRIDCKKIILTTDQDLIKDGVQPIDDEFLEWFVKNPSCEEVEVGYGWIRLTETDNEGYWVSIPNKQFEMQQEEPKQETLEEAAEKYADFSNDYVPLAFGSKFNETTKRDFKEGAKWQAERMYSEEEVIKIVEKSRETGLTAEFLLLTEQFKKK